MIRPGQFLGAMAAAFVVGFLAAQAIGAHAAPKMPPGDKGDIVVPSSASATRYRAVWQTEDGRQWCPVAVTSLSWQVCP